MVSGLGIVPFLHIFITFVLGLCSPGFGALPETCRNGWHPYTFLLWSRLFQFECKVWRSVGDTLLACLAALQRPSHKSPDFHSGHPLWSTWLLDWSCESCWWGLGVGSVVLFKAESKLLFFFSFSYRHASPTLFPPVPASYSLEDFLPLALAWSPFWEKMVVVEVSQLLSPHPYCPDHLGGDTEDSHDLRILQF